MILGMARYKHGEFIELMKSRTASNTWEDWRKRHANDPQIPSLGEETHTMVCKLGGLFDLSNQATIRAGLCEKWKAAPPDSNRINWVQHDGTVSKSLLEKVMKASGLRYFELGGKLYIHWSEKS